jgi:hypothetical protein
MLNAIVERCAGIDVGKRELAVTLMTGASDKEPMVETRLFATPVHRRGIKGRGGWAISTSRRIE